MSQYTLYPAEQIKNIIVQHVKLEILVFILFFLINWIEFHIYCKSSDLNNVVFFKF